MTDSPRYFVILGSMRCGSNLLESALSQYPEFSCFGELFNPAFIGTYTKTDFDGYSLADRSRDPLALLDLVKAEAKDRQAGFRLFRGHDQRVLDTVLEDKNCAKIVLKRHPLESFVSLKIAQATDQWILGDAKDRKQAKITFDPAEYETYRDQIADYYNLIDQRLKMTGQTAFALTYPEQKSVEIVNGLAAWLGGRTSLSKLAEPLKRQNPEKLVELVNNPSDIARYIDVDEENSYVPVSIPKVMKPNIPKMVSCLSNPILFAPIPGGPTTEILQWMAALDGNAADLLDPESAVDEGLILHSGHSRRTLNEWMQSHPEHVAFTAVSHPVTRAYRVFMQKIFSTGPNTYDVIRKQLIEHYGLELPPEAYCDPASPKDLSEIGWEQKHHRAAFHQFLKFLKSNLADQTNIRKDGMWIPQTDFLVAFNSAVAISYIVKEGSLVPGLMQIESRLELPRTELPPLPVGGEQFPLSDIYTQQTENLVRKLYEMDYARLGFDDYYAALDV